MAPEAAPDVPSLKSMMSVAVPLAAPTSPVVLSNDTVGFKFFTFTPVMVVTPVPAVIFTTSLASLCVNCISTAFAVLDTAVRLLLYIRSLALKASLVDWSVSIVNDAAASEGCHAVSFTVPAEG